MTITVHNLKRDKMPPNDERHVYVGRAVPRIGRPASPLANTTRISKYVSRERALLYFRADLDRRMLIHGSPVQLEIERLVDLALSGDLHLYCYCAPEPCHADIIAARIVEHATLRRARQ